MFTDEQPKTCAHLVPFSCCLATNIAQESEECREYQQTMSIMKCMLIDPLSPPQLPVSLFFGSKMDFSTRTNCLKLAHFFDGSS